MDIGSWPTKPANSIRFLFPLGQTPRAEPTDDPGVLRVEGRIVGPVDARPSLNGEVRIKLPQLGNGLLRLLVVAGPRVGGGEVDERVHALIAARDRLAAPLDRLLPLGEVGMGVAHVELPP